MKLVVPYVRELRGPNARLLRLAELLGVVCETLALPEVDSATGFLHEAVPDENVCFVVDPDVMMAWLGSDAMLEELASCLLSLFRNVLVHGLRAEPFHSKVVSALSLGAFKSVETIHGDSTAYDIALDSRPICEAFSGISLGPVNSVNDHVLSVNGDGAGIQPLISIGGHPFMAALKLQRAELMFIASADVADPDAEVGLAPLAGYFSRLMPHAMALRHAAGDECWRPGHGFASVVIDDPLLRENYGFLNFKTLLDLAAEYNFHAAIAFIPHNFKRNSSSTTRMFLDHPSRLSICFHGNDHTHAELASTDPALLDTMVQIGESRMKRHLQMTGLACDRVMVFPQGKFSTQVMGVLKSRNFDAAVSTIPRPAKTSIQLTIAELVQPAVLRYEGFPLFLRKPVREIKKHDIAFNLFFGRPVLLVEHHDIFQDPQLLLDIVRTINSLAPQIYWTNLETAVGNSVLTRRSSDSVYHVRAYSCTIRVSNGSSSTRRYSVEWDPSWAHSSLEKVLIDGTPRRPSENSDGSVGLLLDMGPGRSRTCSLVHRRSDNPVHSLGIRWEARAFLRRRLSEVRDNYLSKNQSVLATAKAFQRRFLRV